ncbi:MAG: hypothetical protein AB7T14_09770, partial [Candidatus Methylacidiphilaceae bacterium]
MKWSRHGEALVFALLLVLGIWAGNSAHAAETSASGNGTTGSQTNQQSSQVAELMKRLEDQGIPVQANTKGIVLSGYVDASYTYNGIN